MVDELSAAKNATPRMNRFHKWLDDLQGRRPEDDVQTGFEIPPKWGSIEDFAIGAPEFAASNETRPAQGTPPRAPDILSSDPHTPQTKHASDAHALAPDGAQITKTNGSQGVGQSGVENALLADQESPAARSKSCGLLNVSVSASDSERVRCFACFRTFFLSKQSVSAL
jgi:hypothetical protein